MADGVNIFRLFGEIGLNGVDEAERQLDDVSDTGERTSNNLSKSFTDIATKAGELGRNMAIGLAGIATAAVAGVESTREFRQDWGKLETAFKETGSTVGTATDIFKEIFGILGEDDTSIEAANNLAELTNNTKDLHQWTNILTGVYAKFGDGLPIEGLAEAA